MYEYSISSLYFEAVYIGVIAVDRFIRVGYVEWVIQ